MHLATIEIRMLSENLAKAIYQALKPECNAKAQIIVEFNIITLNFKANTLAMLRALTNSYLRWIITITNTLDVTDINLS